MNMTGIRNHVHSSIHMTVRQSGGHSRFHRNHMRHMRELCWTGLFGGERYKGLKEAYFEKYGSPTGAFEYAHGRKAGINMNNPAGASFRVSKTGEHLDSGLNLDGTKKI